MKKSFRFKLQSRLLGIQDDNVENIYELKDKSKMAELPPESWEIEFAISADSASLAYVVYLKPDH